MVVGINPFHDYRQSLHRKFTVPVCSTVGLVTWGSAVGLVMWDQPDGNISPRLSLYCSQFLLSLIQTEWLS